MTDISARDRNDSETPQQLLEALGGPFADEGAFPIRYQYPPVGTVAIEAQLDKFDAPPEMRERLKQAIESREHDPARALLLELVAGLPDELRNQFLDDRYLVVAALNTGDVNAHALQAGNGGWLIVINLGLIQFVYKAARTLATHVTLDETSNRPLDFTHSSELLATVFDWYLVTGVPFGPDFPIENLQMRLASELATRAEQFVVAHELAHFLLGHTEAGTRSMMVSKRPVRALDVGREQELDADAVGMRLLLESTASGVSRDYALAYAGVELFFQTVGLLESYAAAPEAGTHPSAAARLAAVRDTLAAHAGKDELSTITELARTFDALLAELREHILDPRRRARALATQPEMDARIRILVEEYAYRRDLRHVPFAEAIDAFILETSPEVLCRALAREMRRAAEEFGDAQDQDAREKPYLRLTLITGLMAKKPYLGDPVAAITREEIGPTDPDIPAG